MKFQNNIDIQYLKKFNINFTQIKRLTINEEKEEKEQKEHNSIYFKKKKKDSFLKIYFY